MRIAVDAMGSDARPTPDIAGAIMAAQECGDAIVFVGDETRIKTELNRHNWKPLSIEIVQAADEILMEEKPTVAAKSKPNSSIHVGLSLVRDRQVEAFVTAGNTGAVLTIATLHTLRRLSSVKRPALTSIFPINRSPVIFLDIGANTDSKPEWLQQFAVMGSIYAKNALGLARPKIGLLSNGEEEGKGNQLVIEAHSMLKSIPFNYVGNVEPREILSSAVDVVVCDGFVGNILLKTFEATSGYLSRVIRDELRSDVFSSIGGLLTGRAFGRVRKRLDTFEVGGAPLLGVNGVVIVAHGRSNANAIKNAIKQARIAVKSDVIRAIEDGLAVLTTS